MGKVVLDIRKNSPTYGQHVAQQLSESNHLAMWMPPGFAHGFRTLENDTIIYDYRTNYYNREAEGPVRWNDPDRNIDRGISDPTLSEKDKNAPLFCQLNSKF